MANWLSDAEPYVMPKRESRLYPTQYVTDLTNAQWAAIAPIVTNTLLKGGRPTEIDLRAIVNAFTSKHRTDCQWRLLPIDILSISSVRSSFDQWSRDGAFVIRSANRRESTRLQPGTSVSVLDS